MRNNREDKSNAPFVSALKAYAERNAARFTFPGHNRGMAAPPMLEQLIGKKPFIHDLAEINNFFSPEGPILEAHKKAAELFGATATWFLVGGTCGVEVSILSTCSLHGFIWCFAQASFLSTIPHGQLPVGSNCIRLQRRLMNFYHLTHLPIDLSHDRQIPVNIDKAHGANLKFDCRLLSTAREQEADLVVQSTNKVLCSLSQSSMLHLSGSMVEKGENI
ncbi:hypothetical protein EJ110_NYTH24897 [Nymphaea thermarum]|nr:hypothetical protein EJ110_NYTH24897 [Nymphaea thermarum]